MLLSCLSRCSQNYFKLANIKQFSTTLVKLNLIKNLKEENQSSEILNQKIKTEKHLNEAISAEAAEWTPIYRFKRIKTIGFMSRLKIGQTGFVVSLVPLSYWWYAGGQMDQNALLMTNGAAILAMVMLYVVTAFTQRLIGVISISNDRSVVRIGYLTFWGFRQDVIVPVEDLVPISDMDYRDRDFYITLKRYSDADFRLHMAVKEFTIVDEELFEQVFGQTLFK